MKVDEAKQQQLRWSMHEHRKNESPTQSPHSDSSDSDSSDILWVDSLKEVAHRDKRRRLEVASGSRSLSKEAARTTFPAKLNVVISPYPFDNSWKASLGEVILQLLPEQNLAENFFSKKFHPEEFRIER